MGYSSLDSSLSFPDNNLPPNKKLILITDTLSASGNFLIHHFIVNQIKSDKHVILVGFSQIFNHYLTIGRKLVGLSLYRVILFIQSIYLFIIITYYYYYYSYY
jgi:hypothetical protein